MSNSWTARRKYVLVCQLVGCAVGFMAAQAAQAGRIWFERGLATVTVGYDAEARQYTHRKFYAVAYGPLGLPGTAHDAARSCTSRVVTRVGEDLRVALWKVKLPASPEFTSLDADARSKAAAARDAQVDAFFNDAIRSFRQQLQSCSGGRFDSRQFHLALIHRVCDTRTNSCSNTPLAFADHPAAVAFSVLSEWVDARNGQQRTLPANAPVLLPDLVDAKTTLKQLNAKTAKEALAKCEKEVETTVERTERRPLACLSLEIASREFTESNIWPNEPPPARAQAELEQLVVKARNVGNLVDRSVPRVVDVPRELAIRFVDVLGEPQEALLNLRTDAAAKLLSIQDELARSRIIECTRFRGLKAPAQVAECAGYNVDPSAINQCLSGGSCVPALGSKGYAGVLAQMRAGNWKEVALSSLSPRTSAQLQQLEATARACAKAGSHEAAATCALERQLGEKEKKAWACVRGKNVKQLDVKTVECTIGGAMPSEAVRAVECAKKFKNNTSEQGLCVLEGSLPPVASKLLDCQRKYKSDAKQVSSCMAGAVGGDVGKAATCIEQFKGDWGKSAMCYAGDKVPKPAADALECAQKSTGTVALGSCVAAKNLPDNLRKPAQCIAESGGEPLGVGVCMASDGLNADQRIALQCLASTGGEPTSFATCTGGRLFVKEMFNCVDKKLFEDKCMGENNEIRKFLKALGVNLTPNTVVGQALNVPLEVIKFQIAVAQAALKGLDDLGKNLNREMNRAAEDIGRETGRIANQAKTDANNGIEWLEKRVGIRLPRL